MNDFQQSHRQKCTAGRSRPNPVRAKVFQLRARSSPDVDVSRKDSRLPLSQCNPNKAVVPAKSQREPALKPRHANPPIPSTDSIQTTLLWQRVLGRQMSSSNVPRYQRATVTSQKKKATEQDSSAGQSPQSSKTPTVASTHLSTVSSTSRTNLKLADKTFRARIFPTYGIRIEEKPYLENAYKHFGTENPLGVTESQITDWYQKHHPDCSVWLSLDEKDAENVAQQYTNMIAIRSNEAKLSHRGKLYFFKDDLIFAPGDASRCSSSYFELEWAPNPDGEQLLCPPRIDQDGETFGFKTNPDCTYWLTTRRFNSVYRKVIDTITFVLPDAQAACPYLTVEFKKTASDFTAALNQLAVSSTLILYNRICLRCKRLRTKERIGQEDFDDVKHYGIAFNGSQALVYLIQPVLSTMLTCDVNQLWKGCTLTRLHKFDTRETQDVRKLRAWINEIHNWGLGKHSKEFERDIKGVLRAMGGGEEDISLMLDEIVA